jgi:hypothetical protein
MSERELLIPGADRLRYLGGTEKHQKLSVSTNVQNNYQTSLFSVNMEGPETPPFVIVI